MRKSIILLFVLTGCIRTGTGTDISAEGGHHYYGGMGMHENVDAQVIADTDWNLVYTAGDWTTGIVNGITFQDGDTGAITAFAEDVGDTEVRVTSNGHGLSNGELVSIVDTADTEYQGVWEVYDSDTNTFDIKATWDDDDGRGTWVRGGNLTITNAGIYQTTYHTSIAPANGGDVIDVALFSGATAGAGNMLLGSEMRLETKTAGNYSTPAGCDTFTASAGDILSLGVKNTTGGNNVTFRYIHVSIFQL